VLGASKALWNHDRNVVKIYQTTAVVKSCSFDACGAFLGVRSGAIKGQKG
jgi:hypothetical protein